MNVCVSMIDDSWKNLIQQTICSFNQNKIATTWNMLLSKFKEI